MKKLIKMMIPSVIGSGLTIAVFLLIGFKQGDPITSNIKQEQTPVHNAVYTVKENGELVPLDFTGISKEVMNSVVHIRSVRNAQSRPNSYSQRNPFEDLFGEDFFKYFRGNPQPEGQQRGQSTPRVQMGAGSGVIISEKGFIVTNNHVIDRADEIEVTLHNNETYKAKVIGTDPSTDLALLQIGGDDLQGVSFGNSDMAEVGEWVMAIGNPFNLNSTVTAGIISAKGRNINIINDRSAIEAFIQTDAAINPGNSGGALVNLNGELIGINTAIASPTGAYAGYGFAIPANIVSKVVADLMEHGMVQRAYLGVMIRDIDRSLLEEKKLKLSEGSYVDSLVANSAAAKAGILPGDVITEINDVEIQKSSDLMEQVGTHRPGDEVAVSVDRFGKSMTFTVQLADRNGEFKLASKDNMDVIDILGATFEELDEKSAEKLGIEGGVKIKELGNGLLKNQTSVSEGFIITGINHKKVTELDDIRKSLEKEKGGVLIQGMYENYPGELYFAFGLPE